MNNNIKILVVNSEHSTGTDSISGVLRGLGMNNLVEVLGTGAGIREFVESNASNPYELTFIHEQENLEEIDLLKSVMEIRPNQYVIILTRSIGGDKVLKSITNGASGILNVPFSPAKVKMELEKFFLLREDKKYQQDAVG